MVLVISSSLCTLTMSALNGLRNVVLVDGCRLPFQPAGTVYKKLFAYDLARAAIQGLLTKTGVSPNSVDYVMMGQVCRTHSSSMDRPARVRTAHHTRHRGTHCCRSSRR